MDISRNVGVRLKGLHSVDNRHAMRFGSLKLDRIGIAPSGDCFEYQEKEKDRMAILKDLLPNHGCEKLRIRQNGVH